MKGRPPADAVGTATATGTVSGTTVVMPVLPDSTAAAIAGLPDLPPTVRTRTVEPDTAVAGATTGVVAGPGSPDVGEAARA